MATAKSLSSLLAQSSLDDHEELLNAANEVLKKSKTDSQARRVKLVALLKLDRFEEALQTLEEAGSLLKHEVPLENAYALYKNGQLEAAREAARAAASEGDGRRSLKHVEAQATYRMEQFSRTSDLYTELSEGRLALEEESNDIRINRGATDAQLGWAGNSHLMLKKKPGRQDLEQFETAFNAACGYIAQGEFKQASFLLGRARDLCSAADELSEEDRNAELLPITVQQIYVLSRLGNYEEADKLASSIKINDISDQATRHIAQTNQIFLSSNLNPYKARRTFHASSEIDPKDRPFRFQALALHQDSLALDLQAGKTAGFAGSDATLTEAHKEAALDADPFNAVFVAASRAQNKTGKSAVKTILPLLERHPANVGLLLTAIQMYLFRRNTSDAAILLDNFFSKLERSSRPDDLELRFTHGLVGLRVALYAKLKKTSLIKSELARASSYWRQISESMGASESLLRAAGVALLDNPTAEEAQSSREIFQWLSQEHPSDRVAVAGLAACSKRVADVQGFDKTLPTIAKLTEGNDAVALEEAGIAKPPPPEIPSKGSKKRAAPELQAKPKAKKSRPSKPAKNYDASKQPDPERWLALRDRSNWRPKGKKKGRAGGGERGGMTQGGVVHEDNRPSTPGQGQQQTKQGGQSQVKKKKGRGK